jgi:hypothetical protein
VRQDQLAERRDPDRPRPAGPVEHRAADGPFERGDLLAHRPLRVAEPLGGAAERSLDGYGVERHEVTQFEGRERTEGCRDTADSHGPRLHQHHGG